MDERFQRAAVARSRQEYGPLYEQLRFVSQEQAKHEERKRAEIIAGLGNRVRMLAGGTKLHSGDLSPGCKRCVEGAWSCLFINGRCNTRCFYCPSPQDEQGVPITNAVPFAKSNEYVEYVSRFGFGGVSISGGEPLLSPELAVSFLRRIKQSFGKQVHLWLYTNGTKLDPRMAAQLAEAGLDELRVDIGATDYRLDAVRLAASMIPVVTVEIPAIPEDEGRLGQLLPELIACGVKHLNLHQLRLTPHNFPKLVGRGYTFLHGDKVTVLESEMAALRLLHKAVTEEIPLPINYCSYAFKHRYQRAADRHRAALVVLSDQEEVVETGHLRRLSTRGEKEDLTALRRELQTRGHTVLPVSGQRLPIRGEHLADVLALRVDPLIAVQYFRPRILPAITYRNPFAEIPLTRKRKLYVEKAPATPELQPGPEGRISLFNLIAEGIAPPPLGEEDNDVLSQILEHEQIDRGLPPYY